MHIELVCMFNGFTASFWNTKVTLLVYYLVLYGLTLLSLGLDQDSLHGLLLARVEVGGEVGDVGRDRELPEEVDQILLDVQGVERIILTVGVHLVLILQIILCGSQELTEINLPVVGGGGVALLTVLVVPLLLIFVLGLGFLIVLNIMNGQVSL